MNHLALELVCTFLTKDEPNLWKKDVQDLAQLAKTCKQASEACGPLVKEFQCLETTFFPERVDVQAQLQMFFAILDRQEQKRLRESTA